MIAGHYFDGAGSRPHPASIDIGMDGTVRVQGEGVSRSERLDAVEISDRIGNVPRKLQFADGAAFETVHNNAVDAALDALGRRGFAQRVSGWESRWRVAFVALLLVAAISWAFLKFGVPVLANVAARTLPASVDNAIGKQGLEILDRTLFEDSRLPKARQDELEARFIQMVKPLDDGHEYRLEFRQGGEIGANAFALPAGIIVVTDELVKLAKNDDEIVAVLAHEIGHVRGRHALRTLLQSAGVAILAATLLGDVGTASALASAVPVALVEAKNSRAFEREADDFAHQWLREHNIPRTRFDALLCALEAEYQKKYGRTKEGSIVGYLSSHPPTEERADCGAAAD